MSDSSSSSISSSKSAVTRTATPLTTIYKNPLSDHGGRPPAGALITPFSRHRHCRPDFLAQPIDPQASCAPPGFFDRYFSTVGGAGYYSPAVCPQDWTVCADRWHTDQGPPLDPGETAGMCAPPGWICVPNEISWAIRVTEIRGDAPPFGTVTRTLLHPMIQVRYKETDSCKFAPSGASPQDPQFGCLGVTAETVYTTGTPSTGTGEPGPGYTLPTVMAAPSQQPSAGVFAGSVIGAIAVMALVALLVFFGFRTVMRLRRAKNGRLEAGGEDIAEMGESGKADVDARSVSSRRSPWRRGQVGAQNEPAELPGCGLDEPDDNIRVLPSGQVDSNTDGKPVSTAAPTTTTTPPRSAFAVTPSTSPSLVIPAAFGDTHMSPSAASPESIPLPVSPLSSDCPQPTELSARTPALAAARMAASEKFLPGQNPLLMDSRETRGSSDSSGRERSPALVEDQSTEELDALRVRSEQLLASRMRLLQLQKIEEEQAAVQRRIEKLEMEGERRKGKG